MRALLSLLLLVLSLHIGFAVPALESVPQTPCYDKLHPIKAPVTSKLYLKKGDRLAICGDSITEQKMYSRMMETYLTVCMPEYDITVRQYGWSGERAGG